MLLVSLQNSRHLHEFCNFDKIPDTSKITHFKYDFLKVIQTIFKHLVELTTRYRGYGEGFSSFLCTIVYMVTDTVILVL